MYVLVVHRSTTGDEVRGVLAGNEFCATINSIRRRPCGPLSSQTTWRIMWSGLLRSAHEVAHSSVLPDYVRFSIHPARLV